jgi:hypothetical protein
LDAGDIDVEAVRGVPADGGRRVGGAVYELDALVLDAADVVGGDRVAAGARIQSRVVGH